MIFEGVVEGGGKWMSGSGLFFAHRFFGSEALLDGRAGGEPLDSG